MLFVAILGVSLAGNVFAAEATTTQESLPTTEAVTQSADVVKADVVKDVKKVVKKEVKKEVPPCQKNKKVVKATEKVTEEAPASK